MQVGERRDPELDLGAAGIFVPHIKSAETALAAIAATRYMPGERGFSASHRAGGYGSIPIDQYIEASDKSTIIMGQIEDVEAVENIDEIAGVAELDALFIGPADLSVSYGKTDWNDPAVEEAIEKVSKAALKAGKAIGIFQSSTERMARYQDLGISMFTISTDQALLTQAVRSVSNDFKAITK